MYKVILSLIAAVLLCACTSDDGERFNSTYACNFIFDTQLHPTSALARCLSNPGMFVKATVRKSSNGALHIMVDPAAGGEKEDVAITTESERRAMLDGNFGANSSLIIGLTNFNGLAAYDAQCAWCLDNAAGNSFPLAFQQNGQKAACAKCQRVYDLNTSTAADCRLKEYRVEFDGRVLRVHN